MIRFSTPMIYKEYQISTLTTHLEQQMVYNTPNERQSLILESVGDRTFFKFGTSSVVASKVVTSGALPDGNFSVAAGAIVQVDLPSGVNLDWVSVVGLAGSGTAIIKLANNNI